MTAILRFFSTAPVTDGLGQRRSPAWANPAVLLAGAIVEVAVFFAMMPPDSTQPPNTWQSILEATQAPGTLVVGLFAAVCGHALDLLPRLLASIVFNGVLGLAFLIQVAMFAALILVVVKGIHRLLRWIPRRGQDQ